MFHANLSRKNWSGNTNIRTSIVFKKTVTEENVKMLE